MLGTFFINYIFVAIFNHKEQGSLTDSEFLNYITTVEYQNKLTDYINSNTLLISIILGLIFIPVFYKLFKKYKQETTFKINNIILPIVLGITISLIYNITLFNLNNLFHFTNMFDESKLPILVQIISSGIIGPILEELVFRGIVYNKLKEFNKPMTAIILASVIFALMHFNLINAIYAFGVSFMFIYLYEKYKDLKMSIIMHMSLNITIILMFNLITLNYTFFNMYLLVVSTIVLIIIKKYFINYK